LTHADEGKSGVSGARKRQLLGAPCCLPNMSSSNVRLSRSDEGSHVYESKKAFKIWLNLKLRVCAKECTSILHMLPHPNGTSKSIARTSLNMSRNNFGSCSGSVCCILNL